MAHKKMLSTKQKGISSIFIIMIILSVILVVALSVSSIITLQMQADIAAEESAKAYYIADSGMEYFTYEYLHADIENDVINIDNKYFCDLCISGHNCEVVGDGFWCLKLLDSDENKLDFSNTWADIVYVESYGQTKSASRAVKTKIE